MNDNWERSMIMYGYAEMHPNTQNRPLCHHVCHVREDDKNRMIKRNYKRKEYGFGCTLFLFGGI